MVIKFVYDHRVMDLLGVNGLWLACLGAIHLRATGADGNFFGSDARLYYGFGLANFLLGLVLASAACILYG
jgi:hypothetical protein